MIAAVKLLRLFDGHHVLNVFHHADEAAVASLIGADGANVGVADVVAHATMLNAMLHRGERLAKTIYLVIALAQKMKHQAKGRLAPYAWQLCKFAHGFF